MTTLRDKILNRRSPLLSKRPEIYDIDDGELALNYNSDEPGLYFKDIAPDGTRRIRKIGPIHYGSVAPNHYAAQNGYYLELSDGECWIDTGQGTNRYSFKVWNRLTSQWIELTSQFFASKSDNLDQFINGTDGDNFIHTDGIRLKINNKAALAGFSTAGGNKLILNEGNQFASGIELSGAYALRSDGNVGSSTETSIKTTNVSLTTPTEVERFGTTYRSAKYVFQIEANSIDNSGSKVYQTGEILLIHDGTNVSLTEYAAVTTYGTERSGTFDATVNAGTQSVVVTFQKFAGVPGSVKVKMLRTSILV